MSATVSMTTASIATVPMTTVSMTTLQYTNTLKSPGTKQEAIYHRLVVVCSC